MEQSMDLLHLTFEEIEIMYSVINKLQILFHPVFAPNGQFSFKDITKLQSKNTVILADNNIISPICEIARKGMINDDLRFRKISLFVIWTKYIHARLTCGLGLLENDTARISCISGEKNRKCFLYAVDGIPLMAWKMVAFGEIDQIPEEFLYKDEVIENNINYDFSDNKILMSIEAALIKMTNLILESNDSGFEKYMKFLNWYIDHLEIGNCILFYSAAVFGEIKNVSKPKGIGSKDYAKIVKGIRNQAWDLAYLAYWSTFYYSENSNDIYMFATDDITQKIITINTVPPERCIDSICGIFKNKNQISCIVNLFNDQCGDNRKHPFNGLSKQEALMNINNQVKIEYEYLKNIIKRIQ